MFTDIVVPRCQSIVYPRQKKKIPRTTWDLTCYWLNGLKLQPLSSTRILFVIRALDSWFSWDSPQTHSPCTGGFSLWLYNHKDTVFFQTKEWFPAAAPLTVSTYTVSLIKSEFITPSIRRSDIQIRYDEVMARQGEIRVELMNTLNRTWPGFNDQFYYVRCWVFFSQRHIWFRFMN